MAIRCYVGKGNDYKEEKCAIDDHSCVKELGSIIFSVKSIFHENFHENDFTKKLFSFFPDFWNRKKNCMAILTHLNYGLCICIKF